MDKQRAVMRGSPLPLLSLPPRLAVVVACSQIVHYNHQEEVFPPSIRPSFLPSFAVNLLTTMIPAAATTAFVTSQRTDGRTKNGGCSPLSPVHELLLSIRVKCGDFPPVLLPPFSPAAADFQHLRDQPSPSLTVMPRQTDTERDREGRGEGERGKVPRAIFYIPSPPCHTWASNYVFIQRNFLRYFPPHMKWHSEIQCHDRRINSPSSVQACLPFSAG